MSDAVRGGAAAPAPRVYRRTLGTRLLAGACAALLTSGALAAAINSGLSGGVLFLAALALLSLANLVTAFGDRYTLSEQGIEYGNRLLRPLGRAPRRVAWGDIERLREHHRRRPGGAASAPSALFLTTRSGRRLVLDSLERYDEVLATVRRHCAAGR
jgi:hypothetical protein